MAVDSRRQDAGSRAGQTAGDDRYDGPGKDQESAGPGCSGSPGASVLKHRAISGDCLRSLRKWPVGTGHAGSCVDRAGRHNRRSFLNLVFSND